MITKVQHISGIALSLLLFALIVALGLLSLYPAWPPMSLVMLSFGLFVFYLVAWMVLGVVSIKARRIPAVLWACLGASIAFAVFIESGLGFEHYWKNVEPQFRQAALSNQCPAQIGVNRISQCLEVDGQPGFDFGGGFIDRGVLVYSPDQQPVENGYYTQVEDITPGWYSLVIEF